MAGEDPEARDFVQQQLEEKRARRLENERALRALFQSQRPLQERRTTVNSELEQLKDAQLKGRDIRTQIGQIEARIKVKIESEKKFANELERGMHLDSLKARIEDSIKKRALVARRLPGDVARYVAAIHLFSLKRLELLDASKDMFSLESEFLERQKSIRESEAEFSQRRFSPKCLITSLHNWFALC